MASKSSYTVLKSIPLRIDLDALIRALHLSEPTVFRDDLAQLVKEAETIAKPKGIYRLSGIEHLGDDLVRIDEVEFQSRVLCVNTDHANRVFPFIATCGRELDAWAHGIDDIMQQFWAENIKEFALRAAIQALGDHLVTTFQPGKRATMNPGSLADWPISQQRGLFSLFDDVAGTIGVELTESFTMVPIKSVSGLWFETEKGFQNCQLCPRENCRNRRAPYDPHLFDLKYRG
jgi:hypothetical protein